MSFMNNRFNVKTTRDIRLLCTQDDEEKSDDVDAFEE